MAISFPVQHLNYNYRPIGQQVKNYSNGFSRKRINPFSTTALDNLKKASQETAFKVLLEKTGLSNKLWADYLEKLRKAGGGGGSDSKFDRIAVSMMLSNFLSNKQIRELINNLTREFVSVCENLFDKNPQLNINFLLPLKQITKLGINILSNLSNALFNKNLLNVLNINLKNFSLLVLGFLVMASSSFHKLKEIIEEELRKAIKKTKIKNKLNKIEGLICNFVVDLKELIKKIFSSFNQNRQAPNHTIKSH